MKNKDKYDLRRLNIAECKGSYITDIYHNHINIEYNGKLVNRITYQIGSGFKKIMEWLEEEYVPDILTDEEKAYLSAVIKPFRKDIEYIEKFKSNYVGKEYIYIVMKKDDDYCKLPRFFKGTMYRGMELNKRYTLKELGL